MAVLPGTSPLTTKANISVEMALGMDRFLDREIAATLETRARFWQPDFSSPENYESSIRPNRARLASRIGAIDPWVEEVEMELVATTDVPATVAETERFSAFAVRWRVFGHVYGEGLWLQPKGGVRARVVALPDADQWPEVITGLQPGLSPQLQYARRLAESGCEVIVPTLIDRSTRFSGNPEVSVQTNQPHREFVYRQGYVLGRHVIGIEVQKIRAAISWLMARTPLQRAPVGVVGWGEGGLLALYTAAIDPRVDAALVSGYFGPRDTLWNEPLYRNVFGLLNEFADAEIARLIVPRVLLIEPAAAPRLPATPLRSGRVPAVTDLPAVSPDDVSAEAARARRLAGPFGSTVRLLPDADALPLADAALEAFVQALDATMTLAPAGSAPRDRRRGFDATDRQRRQVQDTSEFLQRVLATSAADRDDFLWRKVAPSSPDAWREAMRAYRQKFSNEFVGHFERPPMPFNPRSRMIEDAATWTAYEVLLDALPDVPAWAYYLVPKNIRPGERRPVVVTQHGGGGMPADVMTEVPDSEGHRWYKAFARRLAERGFIVLAPHMLNGGHDRLPDRPSAKLLHRKANSIGRTLTSFGVAQHDALLDWLVTRPEADIQRVAFYGLSYGGKAAMRIPAVLERYALSICSADFNEWVWKSATIDYRASNVFGPNYDVMDFNLGPTFNYAEMAALIAPRPFMVERGHDDGVGRDEWVAFEYAKVKRLYAKLKIPDRTAIEYFDGPHTINGVGTFEFLHRHLDWPAAAAKR